MTLIPTPQTREIMDDNRRLLTQYMQDLARVGLRHAAIAMVLAAVAGWIRAYDRGEADADAWFDLDTLAYQTTCEARVMIKALRDQRWLNEMRKMPSWAAFIDGVAAAGGDPVFECQLMMLELGDQLRRKGAA